MCGILYLKRNDNYSPVRPLLARYHEQKSRGQQGFGFVAVKQGKVIGYERSTTFDEIEKKLGNYHEADEILMHHRLPTSTKNLEETAHPIFVSNKLLKSDYYFIHNGVIINEDELKAKHEELGFVYNTEVELFGGYKQKHGKNKKQKIEVVKTEFNDSESLAIEFALFNEGIKKEIETVGSAAFICYEVHKSNGKVKALHYGRNENPMKLFRAHGMFVLSSQSTDKGHTDIEPYKCCTINYEDKVFSERPLMLKASRYETYRSSEETSRTHAHSVGYSVSSYVKDERPLSIADADDRGTVMALPAPATDPVRQELESICLHGNKKITCTKCPIKINACPHGRVSKKQCSECYEDNLIASCIIEQCERTNKPVKECSCKIHRKNRVAIPSPYQNTTEETGSGVSDRSVVLEDKIAALECLIDDIEHDIKRLDEQGTDGDEWYNKCVALDAAKRELASTEHALERCIAFMNGSLF